ncbi:uncharacterized protein LOC132285860 [Cornus florida]|uniref:uncharacterized protein LOC132285860 n=1 Tax=Cornus florida TaxID=4283 RepID=UPI002897F6F9|nr:uncharacterized protein LOC132285860 [Cornus florida]
MEKRLRSSLQTSAEEFLSSATKLGFKSAKPSLKTLIQNLAPSSHLSSSLPFSLRHSISQSITRFKQLSQPTNANPTVSPKSPPTKRLRRSSRNVKNTDDSGIKDREAKIVYDKQCVIQSLQIYAYMALLCVSHPTKAFSPSDLLPAVQELHDNLILFESESVLLSEIASLCEEWWKEQLPGRETLISQFLPFLLSRSLTLKKKVDVHRVYVLREAFTLFDFEDESIEDLKLLLVRCLITPLYLKTEDGRRFLGFMFGLNGQLVKEALAMIRSQIHFERKSMLEAYADIVFRAWKVAEGVSRDEIENGFLQGLVEGAIYASSASFAASIRRVLGGFVNQRTTDGVERLLFRLAEPVIFRSLQVANSNVRQNALHLLLDLFPLEDPDSIKEVKDTLLDKQFFLLERLLVDECPDVRVIAVEGFCRILHLFWEIIPSSTITKVITKIFDDMTHDTCNEVRVSTLNGITYMLGNPQTHEILKVLLPRLGHLILDSALTVRSALVDLLFILRDIRSFQFHKVVRLDLLLSTLANDQPLIAQKITKLLLPSYFPLKVTLEEACNRCVALIKRSPMAGAKFCEFALSEGASLQSLMELVKVFISLALSPGMLDAKQIDGLLVAAAYLCKNLADEASYKAALKALLSGEKLKSLFGAAATKRAQSSVCDIVSIIYPDDVGCLLEECLALVTNCSGFSENAERQAEVRSAHRMMLSCNWFDDMFEALTKLLQKTAYGCHIKFGTEIPKHNVPSVKRMKLKSSVKISAKPKRVNGKKSSNTTTSIFEEDYLISVEIAWQIKDMLISEDTRKAMLGSPILEVALCALKVISEVSIVQCMHCDYMDTSPVLAYTALTLHMSLQNVGINLTNNRRSKENACLDSAGSSLELPLLDQTMDHLLKCTNKLFVAGDSGNCSEVPSVSKQDTNKTSRRCGQKHKESQEDASNPSDGGSICTKQKRISNVVKMPTAVLKFVVDATMVGLLTQSQKRCLKFTLGYVEFIISNLRGHSCNQPLVEEDLKDAFLCLKSSITYAAKLLNLVLISSSKDSPPPPEVYSLANDLLDLIISIELYLGSGYAARLVAAMQPWLPDLVLALGSNHILRQTREERTCTAAFDHSKFPSPLWSSILAKIELHEINKAGSDEEGDGVPEPLEFSAFNKLVKMMVVLLRENTNVLDAVGVTFLTGSIVGLEKMDFELVFGLLHFVCVKLVGNELGRWGELSLMLASLHDIYPRIEKEAEEISNGEDQRQKLENIRALLEPVWMYYIYGTGSDPMTEE